MTSLCLSYDTLIKISTEKESLEETNRKPNQKEGLTNINDSTFKFLCVGGTISTAFITYKSCEPWKKSFFFLLSNQY